ncbi:septum formation initiator family protein [Clostridium sp. UBA6640]|uniref:septum formation initiator family protein n=1 Tax=Clostridium sp. UBA6640 TaxID=1946370 RepID=UPI0025B7EA33|nr:septum formation initiator family protein [Clostridium sp. UBA6640]
MLVEKDKNVISGNTVLKPKITSVPKKQEDKKHSHKTKIEKKQILKRRLKLIRNIGLSFVVAIVILFRYSSIYKAQGDIIKKQDEIYNLREQNESMRVELIKFNNLKYIEDIAINKLNMKKPNAGVAIYCNLEQVEVPHGEKVARESKEGFFEKIKNILF